MVDQVVNINRAMGQILKCSKYCSVASSADKVDFNTRFDPNYKRVVIIFLYVV